MVEGLILILRVAVCQVDVIRGGAKGVGHLRLGGAIVELIGEGQRLGALLVEETLVVEATIERGTRVLHIGGAAITETIAISIATHRGE